MTNRRTFLGSAIGVAAASRAAVQRRQPNILFMFSDDHAYQAISAYGGGLNRTPNIDRIAHEGVRFDNCLVTNSICAPSRAVVLTGRYSHLNGVIDNRQQFDGSQQTMPKLLRAAGYQTAMIGKWHLKSDPTGFTHWEVLPGQGNYYNPDFVTASGRRRRDGYVTEIISELCLDWLKNGRDSTQPFLLMCQHKAPHRNWMPALDKLQMYDGVTFPAPSNLFDDYEHRASPAHQQEMEIARHMTLTADLKILPPQGTIDEKSAAGYFNEYNRMTPGQKRMWDASCQPRNEAFYQANPQGRDLTLWKYQRYLQDYLRCISSVDDSVGKLLRYLDASGLADNTLVIYSSDQGFYLGEHGWFDKRWMYEESIRTPLLVRSPGVARPGSVCKLMAANLDFAETFLDVAGVSIPADMQGRSLVPLLRGETPTGWRKSFYYQYYEKGEHNVARHYGVRTGRYTLAHFYESDEWELFDRENDPHQMRSVYTDPAYASTLVELKAELSRLRKELKVPDKDPDKP